MKIEKLYAYPIKSLRETPLHSARLTPSGFKYDRRFMLLRVVDDGCGNGDGGLLTSMAVSRVPEMALFRTEIVDVDGSGNSDREGRIIVRYAAPKTEGDDDDDDDAEGGREKKMLSIPLQPNIHALDLRPFTINLHNSPTTAYDMGEAYNDWFSECFGYQVVLAYLGPHSREVLGSFAPQQGRRKLTWSWMKDWDWRWDWTRDLMVLLPTVLVSFWMMGSGGFPQGRVYFLIGLLLSVLWKTTTTTNITTSKNTHTRGERRQRITFADCAPYLVTSTTSLGNVSSRLPPTEPMNMTKFRPNIVVSGAEHAFEEDFWTGLTVTSLSATRRRKQKQRLHLTKNCVRCTSLNVDYATGKAGTGESGKVLKKLMSDRRVDKGARFSPVFGRYAFLDPETGDDGGGFRVGIGDEVEVSRRSKVRSVHDWPGLG